MFCASLAHQGTAGYKVKNQYELLKLICDLENNRIALPIENSFDRIVFDRVNFLLSRNVHVEGNRQAVLPSQLQRYDNYCAGGDARRRRIQGNETRRRGQPRPGQSASRPAAAARVRPPEPRAEPLPERTAPRPAQHAPRARLAPARRPPHALLTLSDLT